MVGFITTNDQKQIIASSAMHRNLASAYFNRSLIYQKLANKDLAKAKKLGFKKSDDE